MTRSTSPRSNPRFPVYVISKGRWDTRMTMRVLAKIGVPFKVVVEEGELELYAAHIPRERLLVFDPSYWRDFDPCDGFGDRLRYGPAPMRNFVWDHAVASGAEWHWVMDDNIRYFQRFNNNVKNTVFDGAMFYSMEEFCLRFTNVAMAGPQYEMFMPRRHGHSVKPITLNTRIYSCQLIRNDVPFHWRSRYNDDTDLSLRMLKAGWCTVLFNAFLQGKAATMRVPGGNTPIYQQMGPGFDGRLEMAKTLVRLHPDVTTIIRRWNRWQHYVDYRPFKRNRLRLRPDLSLPEGADEFGMRLVPRPQRQRKGGLAAP